MEKLSPYFFFYRKTFLVPLTAALFVYFMNGLMGLAVFLSISVLGIVYAYRRLFDDPRRQKLYFYFNLGISEWKLYGFVICLNILILICCFSIV